MSQLLHFIIVIIFNYKTTAKATDTLVVSKLNLFELWYQILLNVISFCVEVLYYRG